MGKGGSISGVVGRIKWSYYVAAAINGYRVTRDATTEKWSLRANIVQHDGYKLAQRPLVFEAPHRGERDGRVVEGVWRWPIVDMDIAEGVMTAQLGAPEELEPL